MNPVLEKATHIIPDKLYLRLKFRQRMGKWPHLNHPQTFNEKLQWIKLNDRNPLYTKLVDKYEAREFLARELGEDHLVRLLGVWEHFDDIPFEALPNQFVLKCTHDSGGLVICRDKSKLDISEAKQKIESSQKRNYYWHGREWPYKDCKPRIICETFLEDGGHLGLTDYKFFCYNHIPKFVSVSSGLENHKTAEVSFYDLEGNPMPFKRSDFKPRKGKMVFPDNFGEMRAIARKLAESIPASFVRIDLFSIKGKIYTSEITFSPCSGFLPFEPEEWDRILGDEIKLPKLEQ